MPLSFNPPDDLDVVKLHIYEGASEAGPFVPIETVTFTAGSAPDEYTTDLAVSATDWFAISWEDAKGAVTDLSVPIQGGVDLVIDTVTRRVMERNPELTRNVVIQEAEAVMEDYFGTDPYEVTSANYKTLAGLVYLVLARAIIATVAVRSSSGASSVTSATLGLISFRDESSSAAAIQKAQTDTQALLDLANQYLGINTSFVMELEALSTRYGISSYDESRLIGWVGLV